MSRLFVWRRTSGNCICYCCYYHLLLSLLWFLYTFETKASKSLWERVSWKFVERISCSDTAFSAPARRCVRHVSELFSPVRTVYHWANCRPRLWAALGVFIISFTALISPLLGLKLAFLTAPCSFTMARLYGMIPLSNNDTNHQQESLIRPAEDDHPPARGDWS